MAIVTTDNAHYGDIAAAIREKTGQTDLYRPSEMAAAIMAIQAGGGDTSIEDGLVTGTLTGYYNDRVTKVKQHTFYGSSLKTASFPQAVEVGSTAFAYSCDLEDLSLPLIDNVPGMMCDQCKALTTVDIHNAKAIGNYAFRDCKLKCIDIPIVVKIGMYAFANCAELEEYNGPNSLLEESNIFSNCKKLHTVFAPNTTKMNGYLFSECVSLTHVDFPLVQWFGNYSFRGCVNLEFARFGLKSNYYQGFLNVGAFSGCEKLIALVIGCTKGVWQLSGINNFAGTPIEAGTGYIYVPSALVDAYKAATNWSTYADQIRAIEDYTVDGTLTGDLNPTKTGGATE